MNHSADLNWETPKTQVKRKKSSMKDILQINKMISNLPIMRSLLKGTGIDENEKSKPVLGFEDYTSKSNDELYSLLKNNNKSKEESLRLIRFLQSNKFVQKILAVHNTKNVEFLNALSISLTYEKVFKDNLVIRYGDVGDKFYMIFQGSVSVLVPVKQTFYMTEDEYLKHLFTLKHYNENGLVNQITVENRHIYDISEDDINFIYSKIKSETEDLAITEKNKNNNGRKSTLKTAYLSKLIKCKKELFSVKRLYDECSSEEYISRTIPAPSKRDIYHSKVSLYVYNKIAELGSGEKFGDLAFKKDDQLRSASILSKEVCHFGVLDKEHYQEIIREFNERLKKQNIQFLFNSNLFCSIDFVKKYYKEFIFATFKRGEQLIKQGEANEDIYFLQCGDFDAKLFANHKELISLSKSLGTLTFDPEYSEEDLDHSKLLMLYLFRFCKRFRKTTSKAKLQSL